MQASKPIEARSRGLQGLGRRVLNIPELGAGVAVVVFFLLFTIIDKSMASPAGIVLLLTQAAYMGFAAYGMSYLMLAGEIDLSTGAVAGLAAAVAASRYLRCANQAARTLPMIALLRSIHRSRASCCRTCADPIA